MVDYALNGDFDVYTNEWNDIETVDGLEEFEQDVVVQLHDNLSDLFNGRANTTNAKEKIRLQVTRIAKQFGVIDSIVPPISVEKSLDGRASYEVTVTYDTGDTFTQEL